MPSHGALRQSKFDEPILNVLRRHPQATNAELASAVGCHPRTAQASVKRQETQNLLVCEYGETPAPGITPRKAFVVADVAEIVEEFDDSYVPIPTQISRALGCRLDTAAKLWNIIRRGEGE